MSEYPGLLKKMWQMSFFFLKKASSVSEMSKLGHNFKDLL